MIEAWLNGPVAGVPDVLMPAAHSFVQVQRELPSLFADLTVEQIWQTPRASTSMGFHAMHLAGATDRLLTYARGEQLSPQQLDTSKRERSLSGLPAEVIIAHVTDAMDRAITQLQATPSAIIGEPRDVGRQRLPSTVLGLIFHAAEHATRHVGQIATLRKIIE